MQQHLSTGKTYSDQQTHSSSQTAESMAQHGGTATKKMNVLLFANSIAVGGMEEHIVLLARHLNRDRFNVYAICPDWEPTKPFSQSLGRAVDHIEQIAPDRRYGRIKQITETFRFIRQLRAWNIQVMHMHSTTYSGQMIAFLAARLAGVQRIYITEHLAPDANLPFFRRLSRDIFSRMISGVVCVSEKNYRARAMYLYTPHERTVVVANGVDVDDFPPTPVDQVEALRGEYGIPADAQIIGTVVRFEPEKGLNDLIAALPMIREHCPRAHLLMVGDGSLRSALEQQAHDLGVASYVHFAGFQRNPRPFLSLMDAFVLPVPVGSMSIGLLEAMAMQRAVVITFGGKGEAVIHGESGFCAEPRNPESIAHFVTDILQDSQLQQRLGDAARRRVEEEFSAQRVARVLGDLYYNELLSSKKTPPVVSM